MSVVRTTTTGIPTGRPASGAATPRFATTVTNSTSLPPRVRSARVSTSARSLSADYTCNPDYNIAQVGVVTRWTPVKNLTFSAEVGAFFLDQKFTGAAGLRPRGSEADSPSTSSRTRALCS